MFEYLEPAYLDRSWHLILLKMNPWFDFFRGDPRFTTLLKKTREKHTIFYEQ